MLLFPYHTPLITHCLPPINKLTFPPNKHPSTYFLCAGPLREEFRAQLKLMQDAATTELTNVKKQYEYWLKEKETAMETFTEKFNAYRTKKSNHVPSQHTLSTHPLIHHHIEPKKVIMFLLMYRLTHPLITPCKHNLSTHPLNTPSQPTLSTHPPNTHSHSPSSSYSSLKHIY